MGHIIRYSNPAKMLQCDNSSSAKLVLLTGNI